MALGFALPLSTSAVSILLGLILLLWIIGGDYREKFRVMRHHPLAVAALILFGLHVLGLLYGKPSTRVAFDVSRFLLLALLIPLFRDEDMRRFALKGFLVAAVLLMGLSYLAWFSLLPPMDFLRAAPGNPLVIQQGGITYAFFVTIAAYFFAVGAYFAASGPSRWSQGLLAILAVGNIYLINNKTAFVVLPILAGYFLISQWRWKGAAGFIMVIMLLAVGTYQLPESALHQRIAAAVKEFQQWQPDRADVTSTGLRLEFYRYSFKIIRENPVFGIGVGNFAESYAKQIKDSAMDRSDNPHNEYLHVTANLGLVGLAALLYLFYTQWRLAPLLPAHRETLMARGVVLAIMVGCLFNSWLTGYDVGVFFIWASALFFSGFKPLRESGPVSP
jgi:O-antigen ligase